MSASSAASSATNAAAVDGEMEGEGDDGATRGRFVSTRYSARRLARSRFAPSAVGAFSVRGDDDGEGGDAAARDAFLVFFSFFSFLAALAAFLAAFLEAFSADPSGTAASPHRPGTRPPPRGQPPHAHRRETPGRAKPAEARRDRVSSSSCPSRRRTSAKPRAGLCAEGGRGRADEAGKSPPRGADARLPEKPRRDEGVIRLSKVARSWVQSILVGRRVPIEMEVSGSSEPRLKGEPRRAKRFSPAHRLKNFR